MCQFSSIVFCPFYRSEWMSKKTWPTNVHTFSDFGVRERVSLQSLSHTSKTHRNCTCTLSHRATNKDLVNIFFIFNHLEIIYLFLLYLKVPKSPHEIEKRIACRQRDQWTGNCSLKNSMHIYIPQLLFREHEICILLTLVSS